MASERIRRQVERLLDEADNAITNLDWEAVSRFSQAVLALEPDNSEGTAMLAAAGRALGRGDSYPEEASQDLSERPVIELQTDPYQDSNESAPEFIANGRYKILHLLGEGGRKKAYLAHDSVLDREIALAVIKTDGLDEASRVRLTREAQMMARLGDHPSILPIHDFGTDGDATYLVSPLMPGGGLEEAIARAPEHRIPIEPTLEIARSVCRGLEFAHSRGVVHRDVKPENIWIASDGTAKIGGFGLAISIDDQRITKGPMMVGSIAYMPPEQAMGGEITNRADLYSLGAVLYEMVTGRAPFLGDDSVAIIGQHVNTRPVSPTWHNPSCPRSLEALILRLLSKDPSDRPQSANEVLIALDAIDPREEAGETASVQENSQVLDSLAGGIFVGRHRELSELKASLEDSLSSVGRLVMLVGEPGIGKTRTAQELATYARVRGVQVLWGRCHEERGMPPYWPWIQAIRSYVRENDLVRLRSEMGAGAVDIAELVSDVRERLTDLKPPPTLEPEQARFRLFDSITSFLKSASQNRPLVIILDNLHWADNSSLLLLEFLSQELVGARILVVGTYRDADLSRRHPLSRILGELTKERLFQRVLLRGLVEDDVARFIELASGVSPSQELVQAVHRQTEGNPLFVTEVVRLLVQEGALRSQVDRRRDSWTMRIPEGVREVIGRRLDRLSDRCNQTLTTASVIGREFTLEQLLPLMDDLSRDRLLEVVEEALAARVVEELPQEVGRYQFTHTMIQQTLLEELSTTRKVRLHAQIAEVLESQYGDQADSHADELMYHLAESAAITGPSKLVHYSSVAGERALKSHAWEEALSYFQQALGVKEGQPADSEMAWLLFGLGRAQAATFDAARIHEAVYNLRRSFDYYALSGDVERAVNVAEYPLPVLPGHQTGMAGIISQALAMVGPDSHQAGRLLANFVRVLVVEEGDYEGSQDAYNDALRIARNEGDEALEMKVLASATAGDAQYLRLQGTLVKSLRGIELANQADDPRTEVDVRLSAGLSMWWMGELNGFKQHAKDVLPPAERLRDHYWLTSALWMNEVAACLEGPWTTARQYSERCSMLAPTDMRPRCTRALMEAVVGDFDESHRQVNYLIETLQQSESVPMVGHASIAVTLPALARITGSLEHLNLAESSAQLILSAPAVIPYLAMMARCGLGLIAVIRQDAALAREQYDAITTGRPLKVPETFMAFVRMVPSSFMSTSHLLALLAHTFGDSGQAIRHFEDALGFCRRSGQRPELAWTCSDYAQTLDAMNKQRRGQGDGLDRARSLLNETLSIARELDLKPLIDSASALSESLGTSARPPAYPDGLTQREVEVLSLIASGKSNSDISGQLFISLRTVANHVTNIFNKIGVSNRTEAAIYATRQGLDQNSG